MFRFTTPQQFIFQQNFKDSLNYSINKYNKLIIKINEDTKRKKEIQQILYGNNNKNALIKCSNHSVNDLINNARFYNIFFIVSFVSIGALLCYKSKQ